MITMKGEQTALIPGSRSWREALKASKQNEYGFTFIWHHDFASIAIQSDVPGVYFLTFRAGEADQQQIVFACSAAEIDATLIVWGIHSDEWNTYQEWSQMTEQNIPQE